MILKLKFYRYVSHEQVIKDVSLGFLKNLKYSITTFGLPIIFSLICAFLLNANDAFFAVGLFPVIFISSVILPLYLKERKNFLEPYKSEFNSWKLTFWIPIIFFSFIVVYATIQIAFYTLFSLRVTDNLFQLKNDLLNIYLNLSFINYVEILFYLGYGAILGVSFSFFINLFKINKIVFYFLISTIFAFNILFSGVLSYSTYYGSLAFKILSFFSIFRYIFVNGFISSNEFGAFMFNHDFVYNDSITFTHLEILMNFTIPFILISLFISFASSKFRWFKNDLDSKRLCNCICDNKTSKTEYITIISLIVYSTIQVITGAILLVVVNHSNTLSLTHTLYVTGALLVMVSIIMLSILSGLLIEKIYKDKTIFIASRLNNIYQKKN